MPKTKTNDPGAHHASSGALIRRFLPYLANYKMVLCLDLFCAALTTLCDIVLPKIMSTITNSAMGVGITLTAGIVLKLAALYFVLRIIDGAASYYMSSIGHIMGVHIETDMRRDAFDHLLQLDHTYYNNTKVGTIMGRITNDLFDVTEFAHHCPEEFFIAGIKIVASFVILCRASIPLTLAVFACVPLMGVVSVYLNGRLRARFRQQRVQIGELNSTIEDSLLGQGVVKAFAAERAVQSRILYEVLAHGALNGTHVADVLHDGGEGDGEDGDDGRKDKVEVGILEDGDGCAVHVDGQTYPCRFAQLREVNLAHRCSQGVRAEHAEEYGDNLYDSLAPDRRTDDDDDGCNGEQPVLLAVADGGA